MATRPNVLLLHTDQQRYDSLGCNAPAMAEVRVCVTPNIDALAAEGVNFANHFVQNPVCMPSRMSLLTGRYPSNLGIATNGIPLPEETPTLAGMLKRWGYETTLVGKLHFQPHALRDHRGAHPMYGFNTLILSDEPGCYEDAYRQWVAQRAPEALEAVHCGLPVPAVAWQKLMGMRPGTTNAPQRNDYEPRVFQADENLTHAAFVAEETCRCLRERSGKPLFLFAGFYAPHAPLMPPASCLAMLDEKAMPMPVRGEQERVRAGFEGYREADWKRLRWHYQGLVTDVDRNVGKILRTLREEGMDKKTLVVFTSDHGEYLGEHGQLGKGDPGYDCIMRTPLIMRYPGVIPGGGKEAGLVESVDVLPTILDFCAVPADPSVQGRSLVGRLRGREGAGRSSVFMESRNPGHSTTKAVRTTEYLYALTVREGETLEYLFDLKKDPQEVRNVAREAGYAGIVGQMRQLLLERTMEAEGNRYEKVAPF